MDNSDKKYKIYIIFFFIALFLELFVFNFRYYQTMNYKEILLDQAVLSSSLKLSNAENNMIYVSEENERYIEFRNINKEIKNIYIDIKRDNPENKKGMDKINVTIYGTDEANSQYIRASSRDIVKNYDRSKYIFMNLLGECKDLKICPEVKGENIIVRNITINKKLPFEFNFIRFFAVFFILSIFMLLRPSSDIWNIQFNKKSINQKIGLAVLVGINVLIIFTFIDSNPFYSELRMINHLQYHYLAESLKEGHTYLNFEPDENLVKMENPYDPGARSAENVSYRWDHAYFNGKYYVYFGVVPVLIFYLPYYLMTGTHIYNEDVILIISLLYLIFSFLLVYEIVKRYFNKIPYVLYLCFSELLFLSTGTAFALKEPCLYLVPIYLAVLFAVAGLYFWISSVNENGDLKKIRLCIGSLCMALIAGTRPQLLLASFLAIPLFWDKVFKERKMFSRKSIFETAVFILPYIVVAAGIMWYNNVRFGSVFDFGANYNLTTNDMTKRGFVLERIPTGIFMYLFQPLNVTAKFPFINSVNFYTDYMGNTIYESMYGGAFFSHIILFSIFFLFGKIKKMLKDKNLLYFVLSSLIFTVIIVITDTEMAGLLQRYSVDFTWFLIISAIICTAAIIESCKEAHNFKKICFFVICICSLSFLYDMAAFFFVGAQPLCDYNPEFFYKVMYMFKFWI